MSADGGYRLQFLLLPGLYTAVLPMIPGIYAIIRLAGRGTRRVDGGAVAGKPDDSAVPTGC
jgi:hypothetical protein